MAYLENEKEEIKHTWFHEHVVSIQGEEGFQKIIFSKPTSNMYRINYVLSGNNIFISGDIGEAVYTLTCAATIENIKHFNLSYFTDKLSASSEVRWKFNSSTAREQLNDFWKEYEMEKYEDEKAIRRGILRAINESNSYENYQNYLLSVYHDTTVSGDDLDVVSEFGKEMPMRLIAYWVGLQMVIRQLEEKEEKIA